MVGQYQSVAGKDGSSKSQQKWEALKVSEASGKAVLDLGCNEGFFVEKFLEVGAERAVGVDLNNQLIEMAKERVPSAEFYADNWENFLQDQKEDSFDIIIMLSALHYSKNYRKTFERINRILKPNGVFIIEASVDPNKHGYMVPVERTSDIGTDTVYHFTGPALLQLAEKWFGVRWVSQSVMQPGDPVKRAIYYLHPKRPYAVLVFGKSGSGKSRFLSEVISKNVNLFYIDKFVLQLMETKHTELGRLMKLSHEVGRLDYVYDMLIETGKWRDLLKFVIRHFEGSDSVAIESTILGHKEFRDELKNELSRSGYMVTEIDI